MYSYRTNPRILIFVVSMHQAEKSGGCGGDSKEERKKCENNYTQTGKSKQNRGDKDQPAFDTF